MTTRAAQRVLLRLPNWIGDAAMATSVVQSFAAQLPQTHLEVVGRGPLLDLFPGLLPAERCHPLDDSTLRAVRRRFDLGVLLPDSFSSAWWNIRAGIPSLGRRGGWRDLLLRVPRPRRARRPARHVVEEWDELLEPLGLTPSKFPPKLVLEAGELEGGRRALREAAGQGPALVLCPGAAYGPAKRWPVDSWIALARGLSAHGFRPVASGAAGEEAWIRPVAEAVETRPLIGLPVRAWAAALAASRLVISNDSGAAHVAAAAGTPVLGLFGSSTPVWTHPRGIGHRWLYLGLGCSPCFKRECPLGHLHCLRHITPSMVEAVSLHMLGETEGAS